MSESELAATPTSRTYSWGICGTGNIATTFARALRRVDDARLVAVASRTQHRADAFAAEHGADRPYGSLTALLRDPDVDVVYLASPHSEHCREALQVVEAGKHVLVEKPFGLSLAEVEPVLAAAEAHRVFLMEALWSRFLPAYVRLRELVDAGTIGQVRSVAASFGFEAPFVPAHRLYDPALGGGALLDIGIYCVDLAVQLLGPPLHLVAEAVLSSTGVDVNTLVAMRWDDGAIASAHCSLTARLPCSARIIGTTGWIEIPDNHIVPDRLILRPFTTWQDQPDGDQLDLPVGGDGLRHQIEEVHRCLAAGRTQSTTMSWQHSRNLIGTLDRARSAIGLRYPNAP